MNKKNRNKIKYIKKRSMRISWAIKCEGLTDNEIAQEIKKSKTDFLYSDEWRNLRKEAIKRYGSRCLKCGRQGTKKYPINIDHVKPRKFFPELALDINNLQPLCGSCNRLKGNSSTDYRTPKQS